MAPKFDMYFFKVAVDRVEGTVVPPAHEKLGMVRPARKRIKK
jgi:hypothetical protein